MQGERSQHRLESVVPARTVSLTIAALSLAMLSACAGQSAAPVADRSIPANARESGYRVVIPGDTLYSIAWEAGHDYKEVAAWNGIAAPYLLHPGQKLRLKPPRETRPASDKKRPPPAKRQPRREDPPNKAQTRPKAAQASPAEKPKAAPVKKRRASVDSGPWTWPAAGKVIHYAAQNGTNKGVDILGMRGQEIRAAAPGRVVYVGNGLRGYGLLVILKHDEEFLSAYAHSEKVYVKEGDVIKGGEKIADMGNSGADRAKLHFEIRQRGVPVDPLLYLPKK